MTAIEAYLEHTKQSVLNDKKLCPYDIPWLASRMQKQNCLKGCKACWNSTIAEDKTCQKEKM